MWTPIAIPPIRGPIHAVSIPINGESLAVWTDDGVHRVRLTKRPAIFPMYKSDLAAERFDADRGWFVQQGNQFVMHGNCPPGGKRFRPNLRQVHSSGDTVEIDRAGKRVVVRNAAEDSILEVEDFDAAGPLAVAGFSEYMWGFLVVCDSVRLRVFRYIREKEGARAKWKRQGDERDQTAVMAGILADPGDDLPRLVYADWLEEHGDPSRAELIRIQCRLAEREWAGQYREDDPDRKRSAEIVATDGQRWKMELPNLGIGWNSRHWWRGFPGVATFAARTLARQAAKIAEVTPLDWVDLFRVRPQDDRALGRCELMTRVQKLTVLHFDRGDAAILCNLFGDGTFQGLRHLSLRSSFQGIGPDLVKAAMSLPSLVTLELHTNHLTDEAWRELAAGSWSTTIKNVLLQGLAVDTVLFRSIQTRFLNVMARETFH